VHVDQSYFGAEIILRRSFPFLVPILLVPDGPRWCIVNLWRPLSTIYKDPLAVASAASIPESDLVEATAVCAKHSSVFKENKTWTILPGESHEWFYKNEQRPDEVILIKCFDSSTAPGLARRAPHCAFVDPERSSDEFANRESVDVRAVLVFDE
jgi:hypothetical protein